MFLLKLLKLSGWAFSSQLKVSLGELFYLVVVVGDFYFENRASGRFKWWRKRTSAAASMGCAHSMALLMVICVEFSTYSSSKDTSLSLLFEYYETNQYVVTISRCVFRDLNRSARRFFTV